MFAFPLNDCILSLSWVCLIAAKLLRFFIQVRQRAQFIPLYYAYKCAYLIVLLFHSDGHGSPYGNGGSPYSHEGPSPVNGAFPIPTAAGGMSEMLQVHTYTCVYKLCNYCHDKVPRVIVDSVKCMLLIQCTALHTEL